MRSRIHSLSNDRGIVIVVGALLFAATPEPARGQQFIATWIGNGGVWGSGLNWKCQGPVFNCLPNNGEPTTYRVFIGAEQLCNLNINLTFTNVDNTIRGSGKIGNNSTTIVNQDTIIADQPTRLEIDPATGGFNNQGSLRAENGAELQLKAGPFTTSGDVFAAAGSTITRPATDDNQTAGSTIIDGTLTFDAGGTMMIDGGTLGGSGQINANVTNNAGIAAPGASEGLLTINGDYTQSTAAALSVEVGGLIAGDEHDVLAIAGTTVLAGSLHASDINGFVGQPGDTVTVLTASNVAGDFGQFSSTVFGP